MTQPAMSTASWREVLALFDRWAATEPALREAELQRSQAEHPHLYPRLLAMIDADRAAEARDFLGDNASPLPQEPHRTGLRLGAWELREPIGQGGMGQVWLATRSDGLYNGRAAVKLLHAAGMGAQAQARFAREGEFLARLSHPHIAQLLDAGLMPDGTRYLVLEHVAGERIDHWCDARKLSISERLRLFMQVCEAVAYAHTALVVHRDLKPANILVTDDGHVKLLDFGVAKLLPDQDGHELTELTRAGAAGLTPEYAAPEQIEGEPITTATDVYALGVVLFGLLSGARPYASSSRGVAAMARAIVEEPPRSLSAAARESPDAAALRNTHLVALTKALRGDLETIVAKALKKSPAERYATVQELRDDLHRHLAHQPVSAQADSFSYWARKFVQRNRAQVLALAALLLSLVVGAVATGWQWRLATQEAERTRSVVKVLTGIFTELDPEASGAAQVPVLDLLRRGWAQARSTLQADPALRGEVARPLGLMLRSAGDMAGAAEALAMSRTHLQQAGKAATREYLEVTLSLGYATMRLGRAEEARALFNDVIAQGPRVPDPQADEPVLARLWLGTMLRNEGQLGEARQTLGLALDEAERRFGQQHSSHQLALSELADVLKEQGQWDEARSTYARLYKESGNPGSADALRARFSLAQLEAELGRYREAEAHFRALTPQLTTLWGDTDLHTIYARTWHATTLFHIGQFAASEAVIGEALRDARALGEPDVRHVAQVIQARHALRRGDVARAEPLLQESWRHLQAGGPDTQAAAARALVLIGECQLRQGRLEMALATLNQSYAAQRSLYGARHADMLFTLFLRAIAVEKAQGLSSAQADYEEAERVAQAMLPVGHPDRLRAALLAAQARWRLAPTDGHRSALLQQARNYALALAGRSDVGAISVFTDKLLAPVPNARLQATDLLALLTF
jgi:eukaryotic-like serine/threonine-protein kinase